MVKIEEFPFYFWLVFSMIYFSIGNSANQIWSGCYFCMNYILILWAFIVPKSKRIKIIGISLSFSLLMFSAIKFFICPEIERFCIFILFIMTILSNVCLQKRSK
jgi:hypothetical protein